MTDEEALKEIDRQEKRFAAAGFGNGLRLAKSAREYYQTIVKCRQRSAEVAAECAAANEKAVAMTAETDRMEAEARQMLKEVLCRLIRRFVGRASGCMSADSARAQGLLRSG